MLYACYHPERIEALFLISGAGTEDSTREGYVYDAYKIRISDQEDKLPPKSEIDKYVKAYTDCDRHIMEDLKPMPYCLVRWLFGKMLRKIMKRNVWSDELVAAAADYQSLMV